MSTVIARPLTKITDKLSNKIIIDPSSNSSDPRVNQDVTSQVQSCDAESPEEEGPKALLVSESIRESTSHHGQDISGSKTQGLSGQDPGCDRTGRNETYRNHDTGRAIEGDNRLWEVQTRSDLHHGLLGSGMDKLVCEPLREQWQEGTSQIHPICGTDAGDRANSSSGQEQGQEQDEGLSCQGKGSSLSTRSGSVVGTSEASGRDIGVGLVSGFQSVPSRGGSRLHASGIQAAEHSDDCYGAHHERDCPALEKDAGQDRELRDLRSDQADTLLASIGTHEDPDCDYDFFTEAQSQNYHRECQRLIQQMWKELGQVYHQTKLFPKSCKELDLLEIMCSDDSVLTDQVNQLGGSAKRFGLSEGDLKQSCHRKKLFETLVRQRPEHVWFSPECAPWCMWSFLNCTKNIHTGVKIMENRWQNLWQLSLAVVLYRFQKSNNAQFSLEQPCGSLMLKVPCMDEIVHNLSWCQFDMCRVGSLVHPETSEPIRKRMIVCTSSRALHQSLHGKLCNQEHKHRLIQGQVLLRGERIRLSTFTEKYPIKFGRQIAKIILKEKAWDNPIYANEADSHPTKRRRLCKKANSVEIEQMFPCVNWQTVLHIADRTAPRVGIQIIDAGPLFHGVQKLCPNHDIHHLVVCRGTDRLVGPSCQIAKGKAPVRKRVCIRRRFEDIHVEDEWEPWEKLSVKALRRGGVAARVSVTIFASPKVVIGTQPVQPSADAPIHESPAESASEAKRRRVETDESGDPLNSQSSVDEATIDCRDRGTPKIEEDHSVDQSSREFIDWTSQKHGPKFLQLSKER